MRDEALALLAPALARDPAGLWKATQGFTRFGKAGREAQDAGRQCGYHAVLH